MRQLEDGVEETRRRRLSELGAFLRRRRSTLRPSDVDLPGYGRRHTSGLRREEVAQRAGIGLSWYTSLEQGRVHRVAPKTLKAVADALLLAPLEREYVFMLARETFELPAPDPQPPEGALAFVRTLTGSAAYLSTALCAVVAYNDFADELFAFSQRPPAERNVLAMMVREPRMRQVFPRWAESLEGMIGALRSSHAFAVGAEPDAFIEELCAESSEFAAVWNDHSVAAPLAHVCEIRNERLGVVRFDFIAFVPAGRPNFTVTILRPR